jgi:ubiquinone/menaquinone biosynthesis C-methylase UbiE
MATDVKKIINNLLNFYNFDDQIILSIGAGGGQFIEYGQNSQHIFAIDNDNKALIKLKKAVQTRQLEDKYTLLNLDFFEVWNKADVVFFEFCLHEIKDPKAAINHALILAPNILIIDHWPGSEWSYIVDEKEKTEKSWKVIKTFEIKKVKHYTSSQFFNDYEELYSKVKSQGARTIKRINQYRDKKKFTISMSYGLVLL